MRAARRKIGIFGWGLVAPKSSTVEAFEKGLESSESWLTTFDGFGPSNFLVGQPDFDFRDYKPWIDARFEPRKYSQLDEKMGPSIKYAIGAFVQALGQNPGIEELLQSLGLRARIYVGSGLGPVDTNYEVALDYYRAQKRWDRFWCAAERNPELVGFRALDETSRRELAERDGVPQDPAECVPEDPEYDEVSGLWHAYWAQKSPSLLDYLAKLRAIEAEDVSGEVESGKKGMLRRKLAARKKLSREYGCPLEPWASVDARMLWNIGNIPAAQISMLGKIVGPVLAPVAACSTFGTALRLADEAIQLGEADMVVVGATDPPPHPMSVAAFSNARVVSQDGEVSKPFTGLRGTHIAGGACVWIVGDAEMCLAKGMKPLGLEILSVALTSDADHIITPSPDGQLSAIRTALDRAGVEANELGTWDMHATATPGDFLELESAKRVVPAEAQFTARKGTFGHGMAACGGWELTAQHMAVARGRQFPIQLEGSELHPSIAPIGEGLQLDEDSVIEKPTAGKISMGIGGVNACVISRRWEES